MDQNLLLFIVAETASGLKPLLWMKHLILALEGHGVITGWAFQDPFGNQLLMNHFKDDIFEQLEDIQQEHSDLIPEGIDVHDAYGLAHSFWRGATTWAKNCGVSEPLIDYFNRWKESKDGGGPYFQGDMQVHYADQWQLAEKFLKFSQPL